MRVTVVGAGGQVGAAVLAGLSRMDGLSVTGMCRNPVAAARLRGLGLSAIVADATTGAAATVLRRADVVVNCARATGTPAVARVSNEAILSALTTEAPEATLVHLSTVSVYGTRIAAEARFDKPTPDSVYGREKLTTERVLLRARRLDQAPAFVVRLGHVYGTSQSVSRHVIELIRDGRVALPAPGLGAASNAIHYLNVAAGIHALITSRPTTRTVNLVDSPRRTWRDVFDWHSITLGLPTVPVLLPDHAPQPRPATSSLAGRLIREVASAILTAPARALRGATGQELTAALLAAGRLSGLEHRLKGTQLRNRAARPPEPSPSIEHLFGNPAPGPYVQYEGQDLSQDLQALAEWDSRLQSPWKAVV